MNIADKSRERRRSRRNTTFLIRKDPVLITE